MRRSLALSLITFLLVAANAFAAGEGRMVGKILDAATKQPVADAVIKLDAIEGKTVHNEVKARKDGGYTVMVLDATIRYKFVITAPGYAPYEETIKIKLGETNNRDFELKKSDAAAPAAAGGVQMQAAKVDPAVAAFNEGAALINGGDVNGAIAKFNEAVAAKPDLTAGWMALAKANVRAKNYQKAVDAAKKALEVDPDDSDMWGVLQQAYTGLGDKANAAIAAKKAPANPASLFNEAARLINDGKDAEAAASLQRAVEVDAKFAQAWYELGMVYVRTSKNAEAREALSKYLELEPKGKDAATAKEMLNYLK
ncbi:MAG: tetratricopeptide repeat protein [Acidobacteriota bacterium]|nr:tetratricopeptide repeat protein [Acidobacteriota bacterium]